MNIIFEMQNIQQGFITQKELVEKVVNLSKKEQVEVLDMLEYLAEYNTLNEIKKHL